MSFQRKRKLIKQKELFEAKTERLELEYHRARAIVKTTHSQ